jgi:hypothetical protein
MADVVTGALIVVLAVVMVVGYLFIRARQPAPPPPANSDEGSTKSEREASGLEPEGALVDDDPVPRDADGMPMVTPPRDPQAVDADRMQGQARRPHRGPRHP